MALRSYSGVYKSLIQGVSQQTPQERQEGQLSAQENMLSDAVTGLRRRSGVKYSTQFTGLSAKTYINLVNIAGEYYHVFIDVTSGTLRLHNASTNAVALTTQSSYYQADSKASIKTTVSRDNLFIVNTEKVPTKTYSGTHTYKAPQNLGYFKVMLGALAKTYKVTCAFGEQSFTKSITTDSSSADNASAEYVANQLFAQFNTDVEFLKYYQPYQLGTTVGFVRQDNQTTETLNVTTGSTDTYMLVSAKSRVSTKTLLPSNLPSALDGYIMAVGTTSASAYLQYDVANGVWRECGIYEPQPYTFSNEPKYVYYDKASDSLKESDLGIQERSAGDDDNNPYPPFVDYGITGISSYQSRLILLSGSYVVMSKTTQFNQFMKTTVQEVLDDDAISIGSASMSSAQWEYAVPYNKDLVLIAQDQQGVMPSNSTVITAKTAVIYPSTKVNLSLAAEPTVISRTLYYAYQRSTDYYQLGELIPNNYTDSQYYGQNLNDHIPLYATGTCTAIAGSTTLNMALATSDNTEVLVNQFLWSDNSRPLMSFSKWTFPYNVAYTAFVDDYIFVYFYDSANNYIVGTMNTQYNQLDNKPVPYLDFYQYASVVDNKGTLPSWLPKYSNASDLVIVAYDDVNYRHMEVQYTLNNDGTFNCVYNGTVAIGIRYNSLVSLTPPFVKNANGQVLAGTSAFVQSFDFTFKGTGSYNYHVADNYSDVVSTSTTANYWSEVQLGHTTVNTLTRSRVPCRSKLDNTVCELSTSSTQDLNIVNVEYKLRVNQRRIII